MVHSHVRFSKLLREPELIVGQWVALYYMGAFTPAIWSTIAWTEKFNNGLCTHFLRLRGSVEICRGMSSPHMDLMASSFPIIHRVGNADNLALLKFENDMNKEIGHFNYNSKHYGKSKYALKSIGLFPIDFHYTL